MYNDEPRFTSADVGRIADLDPSTVEDWGRRGVIAVKTELYGTGDALRFAAMRSLTGHGVAVYRAAETLRRIEETQGKFWKAALDKCAAGVAHVYVYTAFYSSQAFGVFLYAGDSAAADAFIMQAMQDGNEGELVDESADIFTPPSPVPENPSCRVARYDVGPDLRRAFQEMSR
jgi:hypothetical protein